MSTSPKLELKTAQTLVLTPQLQQAIKLLQMNALELDAWLEGELEANPFLERENDTDESDESEPEEPIDTEVSPDAQDAFEALNSETPDHESLDVSYDNVYDSAETGTRGSAVAEEYLTLDIEDSEARSLSAHLTRQLLLSLIDKQERAIGMYFIDALDENGFLQVSVAEIAEQLGCECSRAERVLVALQRFDPVGIFARSLSECLRLQLQERDALTPAFETLLADLALLGRGEREKLRKLCGVSESAFEEMLCVIRSLNPRPAATFDHHPIASIVPDLLMRALESTAEESLRWGVELNGETLPRVLLNRSYHAQISTKVRLSKDASAQNFLKENWQKANWLTKALDQRARTIVKIAAEIVRRQRGFFRYGVAKLAPLILRDIADAVGMHESTVSRVVNGKYMQTPRGMFELRYFFTKAIENTIMHTDLSAESVRYRIRQLIAEEGARSVLSDDKIAEKLKDEGIEIARRTVTKYREAMRIGSSVDRRRLQTLTPRVQKSRIVLKNT